MTTLYKKKEQGSNWTYIGMDEATLSDLKAALEAHGMVAVDRKVSHLIIALVEATRDGCGVDGDELQEWLYSAGIIDEYEAIEPCCGDCVCANVTDFPTICYSDSQLYKRLIKITMD